MKPGDKCILIVGGKRHVGSILSFLPAKPVFEQRVQVSETPAAVSVSINDFVVLAAGSDDKVIEMDGTEHHVVIRQSNIGGTTPSTTVMAYLKPEAEIPTQKVAGSDET